MQPHLFSRIFGTVRGWRAAQDSISQQWTAAPGTANFMFQKRERVLAEKRLDRETDKIYTVFAGHVAI
jgi:hypothetical protein